METHNDKFRRLAELRLSRIFKTMNLIANLSASQYHYTKEEIDDLFGTYQKLGIMAQTYFQGPTRFNEMPSNFEFSSSSPVTSDNSTGHTRFRHLAESRMSRVVRDLRLLCNLSDRSNYTYSTDEVQELFAAYSEKGLTIASFFLPLTDEFHFSNKHHPY